MPWETDEYSLLPSVVGIPELMTRDEVKFEIPNWWQTQDTILPFMTL